MKKYIKYSLILIQCIIISKAVIAQDNPSDLTQNSIELEAYLDIYYSYDFARPESYQKQLYFYNYNRQNSFQLNLGYLKVKWLREKYRANLVLQAGTYAEDNYTAEPGLLKHVFEANAGLALNSKNTFWLDVGIFSSHIGFESANAFDNWTLTRSLAAENSPYYLSGLKMSYDVTPRFQLTSLVCNGWQRIQKVAGNSLLSFGTQVKITPKEGWLINWSSFIGTDDPDSLRRMRYFNNFYAQMQYSKAWSVILGMDLGFQQVSKGVQISKLG
ncbi:MAG: porin [Saprospiraceae bacterium]|nr:porin [Saprospiraceae bacterium]